MIGTCKCARRGCKHYLGIKSTPKERDQVHQCKAYPKGIPEEISFGTEKHLERLPEQVTAIVFERGPNIFEQ